MKKYLYLALLLSVTGAVLSGIITHQHFYGESKISSFLCGNSIHNSCLALSLTKYSVLWSIPVAVYGLFFYIFTAVVLFISGFVKGEYYYAGVALILPVSGFALLADIVLLIILIMLKIPCMLCLMTYIVNILLFTAVLLCYIKIKKTEKLSLAGFYSYVAGYYKKSPDSRAVIPLLIFTAVFLAISLISTTRFIRVVTANTTLNYESIKKYLDEYNSSPVENLDFPESMMVSGNPGAKIRIIVFTDFLCAYCSKLHETEKYLFAVFKDKIGIEYHNYPLDLDCNGNIQRTIYYNSCNASKAMLASAKLGVFEKYSGIHFSNYEQIKDVYSADVAARLFNLLGTKTDSGKFIEMMNSQAAAELLKRDIAFAARHNIRGTPTLFIGGKRITGSKPKEVLEAIIKSLLN